MTEPVLDIRIARTLDDIQKVMAIRAVVFVGGQDCPYDEEYDGNDLAGSSHLIARFGDEPAGVLRMRWFADFCKVERAAVLPRFRKDGVMQALMKFSLEHARKRGYRRVLGHAQLHMIDYYAKFGFEVRKNREGFHFSDHEYVEIEAELPPSNAAITSETMPLVLLRPEGEWDIPGVLDRSTDRPASNPNNFNLRAAGGH